jgi:FkbM family methyltransferase
MFSSFLSSLGRIRIGGRELATISHALGERRHYEALAEMFSVYADPICELKNYLLRRGEYPRTLDLRTPIGLQVVTLDSPDDLLTVNEVFCRLDYQVLPNTRVVVDFGSNIGISALYFLTRNPEARVFLYEPVPRNVARLRSNLRTFTDRYQLLEVCVGTHDGEIAFGIEPTGRYGGIGIPTGHTAQFPVRDVNKILADVCAQPDVGRIDVLKTDIEGHDVPVLRHIRREFLERIDCIYAELPQGFALPGFTYQQRGMIVRWNRLKESN